MLCVTFQCPPPHAMVRNVCRAFLIAILTYLYKTIQLHFVYSVLAAASVFIFLLLLFFTDLLLIVRWFSLFHAVLYDYFLLPCLFQCAVCL